MKQLSIILSFCFLVFSSLSASAEVLPMSKWKTVTFEVNGNCGMCKSTIEKSLKGVEGVKFAVWNKKTKKITVKYNPETIDLMTIHKKIAAVGYDTNKVKAKDEVYKNLHGCCQYDRKN